MQAVTRFLVVQMGVLIVLSGCGRESTSTKPETKIDPAAQRSSIGKAKPQCLLHALPILPYFEKTRSHLAYRDVPNIDKYKDLPGAGDRSSPDEKNKGYALVLGSKADLAAIKDQCSAELSAITNENLDSTVFNPVVMSSVTSGVYDWDEKLHQFVPRGRSYHQITWGCYGPCE